MAEEAKIHPLPRQGNEVAQFVESAGRIYAAQHAAVRDLESEHALGRAKLIDQYRRRIEDVRHEGEEALRVFDGRHARQISEARETLTAIARLRGE